MVPKTESLLLAKKAIELQIKSLEEEIDKEITTQLQSGEEIVRFESDGHIPREIRRLLIAKYEKGGWKVSEAKKDGPVASDVLIFS